VNYQLVERSRFVPRPELPTPVPDWKRSDRAADALASDDPAHKAQVDRKRIDD